MANLNDGRLSNARKGIPMPSAHATVDDERIVDMRPEPTRITLKRAGTRLPRRNETHANDDNASMRTLRRHPARPNTRNMDNESDYDIQPVREPITPVQDYDGAPEMQGNDGMQSYMEQHADYETPAPPIRVKPAMSETPAEKRGFTESAADNSEHMDGDEAYDPETHNGKEFGFKDDVMNNIPEQFAPLADKVFDFIDKMKNKTADASDKNKNRSKPDEHKNKTGIGKSKTKSLNPVMIIIVMLAVTLLVFVGLNAMNSGAMNSGGTQGIDSSANKTDDASMVSIPSVIGDDSETALRKLDKIGFKGIRKDTDGEYIDDGSPDKFRVKDVFPDKKAMKGSQVILTVIPGDKDAFEILKTGDKLPDAVKTLESYGYGESYIRFTDADGRTIKQDSPDYDDYVVNDVSDDDIPVITVSSAKEAEAKKKAQDELNKAAQAAAAEQAQGNSLSDANKCTQIGSKGIADDGTVYVCTKMTIGDGATWQKQDKNATPSTSDTGTDDNTSNENNDSNNESEQTKQYPQDGTTMERAGKNVE